MVNHFVLMFWPSCKYNRWQACRVTSGKLQLDAHNLQVLQSFRPIESWGRDFMTNVACLWSQMVSGHCWFQDTYSL